MFYQYGNNCLISNALLQNDKSFIKMKYMLHNLEDRLWRLEEKESYVINIELALNNLLKWFLKYSSKSSSCRTNTLFLNVDQNTSVWS